MFKQLARRRSSARPTVRTRSALLRPPKKTWYQELRDLVWDKQKKMCLTRTPVNWGAVIIYYTIFLGIIILIFALSIKIAQLATKNDQGPEYILHESPIGPTPPLNFFPLNGSTNLIWLSENRSYEDYVELITKQLDKYKKADSSYDSSDLGECAEAPYGYDKQTPCIYFRLNRLIKWEPVPYHKVDKLPGKVPDDVKSLIQTNDVPKVWISCRGTTPKDRDYLVPGSFALQGPKGFKLDGYPFERQANYVDPTVALKFMDTVPKNILLSLRCEPWSKGVDVSKTFVEVILFFE